MPAYCSGKLPWRYLFWDTTAGIQSKKIILVLEENKQFQEKLRRQKKEISKYHIRYPSLHTSYSIATTRVLIPNYKRVSISNIEIILFAINP